MTTQLVENTLKNSFLSVTGSAAKGAKRGAGSTSIVSSFGSRAISIVIKNGAATVATIVTTAGGYSAQGPYLKITGIASSTVPGTVSPPSVGPFWTAEIVDQGVTKLTCTSVGSTTSTADLKLAPLVAGVPFNLGVGVYSYLLFKVERALDPFVPQKITLKAAPSAQGHTAVVFGRAFAEGEIPSAPQLVVDGTPTNDHVKILSRWPSGSVRTAKFRKAKLTHSTTPEVYTFQNRASIPAFTPPTLSAILAAFPDFEATIENRVGVVTNNSLVTAALAGSLNVSCSLGAGSTPLVGNINTLLSDAVATWRIDGQGDLIVVPKSTATAGQTSILELVTKYNTDPEVQYQYTYTVLAGHLTTYTKSARTMMTAGKATVVDASAEYYKVRIADFINKTEDYGPLSQLRPDFDVEFWPTLGKYNVKVCVENGDTQKVGAVAASFKATVGLGSPTTIFDSGAHFICFDSFHAPIAWSAPVYEPNYDYDVASFNTAQFLPFLLPIVPSETSVTAQLAQWAATPHEIGDAGLTYKQMTATGGRPDLGYASQWHIRWLLDGRASLRDMGIRIAQIQGSFGMFQREGDATKRFTLRGQAPGAFGNGLPSSFTLRPSAGVQSHYSVNGYNNGQPATRAADKVTIVGPIRQMGWHQDDEHCPSAIAIPALLTGDEWWIEKLQMQACYQYKTTGAYGCDVSAGNTDSTVLWARNKNPDYWGPTSSTRGGAHSLREMYYAWSLTDDASPLKADYAQVMLDGIVWYETRASVPRAGRPDHTWWKTICAANAGFAYADWYISADAGNNPMQFPEIGTYGASAFAGSAYAPWQNSFLAIVFSMMLDGGFLEAKNIRERHFALYKRHVTDPDPSWLRWWQGAYTMATSKAASPGTPNMTTAEARAANNIASNFSGPDFSYNGFSDELDQGYWSMAVAAMTSMGSVKGYEILEVFLNVERQNWITGTGATVAYTEGPKFAFAPNV